MLMALCLLIGLAVGASVKSSSDEDEDSMTSSTTYTDQWAVHIEGGNAIADSIAARHGFTNLGPVCTCFTYPLLHLLARVYFPFNLHSASSFQ